MTTIKTRLFNQFIRIFYPKRCRSCGKIVPLGKSYCDCLKNTYVRVSDNFCEHCASELDNCTCVHPRAIRFEHITAPFIYTGLARERLLLLKFDGEKDEADFFAYEMSQRFAMCFPNAKIDAVAFVPMTEGAVRKRGYNQSELLAKGVSKRLFIPFANVIRKTTETESQHELKKEERLANLDGAFEVFDKNRVKGKTIILCDDIKTTGTTLMRCVHVLKDAGAKDVYCLCAAISDYASDFAF
ncbi:MAG: ComF family protein [Ruminococcus sp.]|nr:ComF family protein [Ruminococcus sp.]